MLGFRKSTGQKSKAETQPATKRALKRQRAQPETRRNASPAGPMAALFKTIWCSNLLVPPKTTVMFLLPPYDGRRSMTIGKKTRRDGTGASKVIVPPLAAHSGISQPKSFLPGTAVAEQYSWPAPLSHSTFFAFERHHLALYPWQL